MVKDTDGPNVWSDGPRNKYDPESATDSVSVKSHPYYEEQKSFNFFNFSGERSCLGEKLAQQQLFLIFTHVLQKFRMSVQEGYTHPPPEGVFALTHRPPPYYVTIKSRV